MPISSFATNRLVEHLNRLKISLFVSGNHHLGDALTILYDEVFLREVDLYHAYLTAIIGVDGAR